MPTGAACPIDGERTTIHWPPLIRHPTAIRTSNTTVTTAIAPASIRIKPPAARTRVMGRSAGKGPGHRLRDLGTLQIAGRLGAEEQGERELRSLTRVDHVEVVRALAFEVVGINRADDVVAVLGDGDLQARWRSEHKSPHPFVAGELVQSPKERLKSSGVTVPVLVTTTVVWRVSPGAKGAAEPP